jgi:hypothetical protein
MFVSDLVGKEFSEAFVVKTTVKTGQQSVGKAAPQKQTTVKTKSVVPNSTKTITKGIPVSNQYKKEFFLKNSYTEEPIVKDASLNIYTGNPGLYITAGDTVNFGNVITLPDSAFLQARHTIVPKSTKPYGFVGKELIVPNQDWILGIILLFWAIFASVRVGFLKYLGQLFASLVNFNAASRLFQQRGYKTKYGAVRLDIIFHLILPLSVFQIATFYKMDIPGYPSIVFFLALLLVINGYLLTKIWLYQLAGSIVMLKEQTEESVFNIRLYYKALGLILLPVVTIHAVITQTNFITIWIMAGLIVIMYVANVIRTIYLGIRKDISIFYLILYLCTLEILPLLLVFKLISRE